MAFTANLDPIRIIDVAKKSITNIELGIIYVPKDLKYTRFATNKRRLPAVTTIKILSASFALVYLISPAKVLKIKKVTALIKSNMGTANFKASNSDSPILNSNLT